MVICCGHIINTLSNRLYDLYNSIESLVKIWNALEYKYKTEKEGTHKFLILKYLEFVMTDTKSVLYQIHELKLIVTKLLELKIIISESFEVGTIIDKLPPSWNGYRKKLLHSKDDITLEDLKKHLRTEEETRYCDPKGNIHEFSKINVAEAKRHRQSDCKYKKEVNVNKANVFENQHEVICAMISEIEIDMIIETNMAATKSNDWWIDSGATIHVCNDKKLFSSYQIEKQEKTVLMGNNDAAVVAGKGTIKLNFHPERK
ncbi:uncharacterized protein [Primulina eburnea]|uniref:uncharacterized protein n=1 Tax=Primulina eburnea TaxID=1245227 RepID=UPI003C6CA752